MYCSNCGNKLKNTENYCTNCGKKIKTNTNNQQSSNNNYEVLSLIFSIIATIFFWNPIISIPLAITSIIFGNKYKKETKKKAKGPIISIISLILSILVIIFIAISIIFSAYILDEFIESNETTSEYYEEFDYNTNEETENYDIKGYSWKSLDNSVLYLKENEKYEWYQDDKNHTNNYHQGTYKYYIGEDAINYIATNLPQYGLTKEEQYKLFEDKTYQLEDYYLIILNCNKTIINGVEKPEEINILYYYGFYKKNTNRLELINMSTRNNTEFIRKDKIKNIDI